MLQKSYVHKISFYLYYGADLPSVGLAVHFLFILCDSSKLSAFL